MPNTTGKIAILPSYEPSGDGKVSVTVFCPRAAFGSGPHVCSEARRYAALDSGTCMSRSIIQLMAGYAKNLQGLTKLQATHSVGSKKYIFQGNVDLKCQYQKQSYKQPLHELKVIDTHEAYHFPPCTAFLFSDPTLQVRIDRLQTTRLEGRKKTLVWKGILSTEMKVYDVGQNESYVPPGGNTSTPTEATRQHAKVAREGCRERMRKDGKRLEGLKIHREEGWGATDAPTEATRQHARSLVKDAVRRVR
ncbi:hypothetical protein EDB83DRAFT_2321614 [Lactarius deliciosus]|nr:hypothetical protein EDB83DRAFT_2321614 [Lactarius deliciosus]